MNHCSKPGCTALGGAVLTFDYDARLAFLDDPPAEQVSPHAYVLCISCADRLDPPRGWLLDDRRAEPPLFVPQRLTPAAADPGHAAGGAPTRGRLWLSADRASPSH